MNKFAKYLLMLPMLAVVMTAIAACSDDRDGVNPLDLNRHIRTAFWKGFVQEHPDLPEKLLQIVTSTQAEPSPQAFASVPDAEVRIHTGQGPISVRAQTIDVIVTDLTNAQLTSLLSTLDAYVPSQNRSNSDRPSEVEPESSGFRVLVLGSDGRIEVASPAQGQKQTVDLFVDTGTGSSILQVHAFGPRAPEAVEALSAEFESNKNARGPPNAFTSSGRAGRPPPIGDSKDNSVTLLVVGKLRSLSTDDTLPNSEQEFRGYINSQECSRIVEIAALAIAAGTVAAKPVRAAEPKPGVSPTYRPEPAGTGSPKIGPYDPIRPPSRSPPRPPGRPSRP